LEVRDSGIGMSAEVRERAFEPFFTTKGKAGTGLGLAEVYGIVKRHRGLAEIESTPGVGATVRLVFPRSSPQPAPEPVIQRPRLRVPRRVLLVEDHPDSREFMQALLESDGHTVDTAGGIQDAMTLLETASPMYEVLVTDIGLADGSGWDLISIARERWRSLRIGVVTGWEPRAGTGVDGDFILRKPVRTAELLAQVAAEG
jgi:CheY-like chemotaxis protein